MSNTIYSRAASLATDRRLWFGLVPLGVALLGTLPHWSQLQDQVAMAHQYWYDAVGHMYLSAERFESLTLAHGFFDFRWFHPYGSTGTYNEPALTHGVLFGLYALVTPSEPLAFNLAMVTILVLNSTALYLLLLDQIRCPWIAAIFALAGGLSPFLWVRYAHPPNTVIFWGILGLTLLRRAARFPTWRRCIAAPLMFLIQLYSSFYVGMFCVVLLVVFVPVAMLRARALGHGRRLVLRCGLACLLVAPLLLVLQLAYGQTRAELGKVNSYEYVSNYMRRTASDLLPRAPLTCQLRVLGIARPQPQCRDELFPGWTVVSVAALTLPLAGLLAVRCFRRRMRHRWSWVRLALPVAGLGGALLLGLTLPFHCGLWGALFWPTGPHRRSIAVSRPLAVYILASLLVVDVALNPSIRLFAVDFASIHQYFFALVPGFDGLRSEYRIVVFLPVLLAAIGALLTRTGLYWLTRRYGPRLRPFVLVPLVAWAAFNAQPAWQAYQPMPRSDQRPPVLDCAAGLPQESVLAVVKVRGNQIVRRTHADANYWLGHILLHDHRQISGYSTYNSPASHALEVAAGLPDRRQRLYWVSRLAYLFGGTHLLLDWRRRPSLQPQQIERMLNGEGRDVLVARDDHLALIALGEMGRTAHGPVASDSAPGPTEAEIASVHTNAPWNGSRQIIDGDPRTAGVCTRAQQVGDWLVLRLHTPTPICGVGFSPGLAVWGLPTAFVVEVKNGTSWIEVAARDRWEVPRALIDKPGTGLAIVGFDEARTEAVRVRLTESSPFKWTFSSLAVYRCSDGQDATASRR